MILDRRSAVGIFLLAMGFSASSQAQYQKDMGIDPDFLYEETITYPVSPPTATTPSAPTVSSAGNDFAGLEILGEAVALAEAGTTGVAAAATGVAAGIGTGSAALASTFAVGAIAAPVVGSYAAAGSVFAAIIDDGDDGNTATNSNSASAAK